MKTHVHTWFYISDPVVPHWDRGGVPADVDAGGGGGRYCQFGGSIRNWKRIEMWSRFTSWIWVRKGKVIAETSKGTHWWPVCLSEVDSPDCCWLHTHGSDSPSLESARSKWSRSCSGAPSHPLHARHLSSDSGCGIQWWKMLEPPSEQWRSWCRYRRNPSQWGNPELEENLLGYVKYQAFSTLFFLFSFFYIWWIAGFFNCVVKFFFFLTFDSNL